jgi:ABC-type multidrug transport system ATPase subunit
MTRPIATLRFESTAISPTPIDIPRQGITIGSNPTHPVVLDAPGILPDHAEILWNQSEFVVQSLVDAAPLSVNGYRISPAHSHRLTHGDRLCFAQVACTFLHPKNSENSSSEDFDLPGTVMAETSLKYLLQITTPDWTQDFPLHTETVVLGTASTSDVVIDWPQVPPRHARLSWQGQTYRIEALNSDRPLHLANKPVQHRDLCDGDCITLAPDLTLTYQVLPQTDAIEQVATLTLRDRTRLTLGRDPRNDTVIDHPNVSRFHAQIELRDREWYIQDLNSSNGTFVNNQPIHQPRRLCPRDTIRVGPYHLIFSVDETLIQQNETGNLRLDVVHLGRVVGKKLTLLDDISLTILPKEFVAIVGVSGAGKSTLLNALNGFQPANQGQVCVNGQDLYKNFSAYRMELGYVPQDDIIHQDLTVVQALDFAARLRLPADVSAQERSRLVQAVITDLELSHRQHLEVKRLSGGQRKRVSIGVELLTQPSLFFLDEATSGLDPGTESQMMHLLRRLADQGRTVMLVTHATKNVMLCDMVLFLAKGGRVAFFGPPQDALQYFEVQDFDEIYLRVEGEDTPEIWKQRFLQSDYHQRYIRDRQRDLATTAPNKSDKATGGQGVVRWSTPERRTSSQAKQTQRSGLRQWWILSQRNLTLLTQDRASLLTTLAIAPLLGLLDFAMWKRDVFDASTGDAGQTLTVMFVATLVAVIVGSLATMREIVKEIEIYRRERMIGLKILPYIFSKIWLCVVLALYDAVFFVLTKLLSIDWPINALDGLGIYFTLFLATLGGMVMGLLVSALSPNQSVAPLLTILFLVPQITFAGSILPLRVLGPVGQVISQVTVSRWSFESLITLSGIGKDVAADPCWQQSELVRDGWDDADKKSCPCLGPNLFKTCDFPGLRKQYDPAVDQPEPVKPTDPGDPPPIPDNPQDLLSGAYIDELDLYNQKVTTYRDNLDRWQDQFRVWKENRGKAIAAGEELLQRIYTNQGDSYAVNLLLHWGRLGAIMVGMLGMLAFFQRRKDTL